MRSAHPPTRGCPPGHSPSLSHGADTSEERHAAGSQAQVQPVGLCPGRRRCALPRLPPAMPLGQTELRAHGAATATQATAKTPRRGTQEFSASPPPSPQGRLSRPGAGHLQVDFLPLVAATSPSPTSLPAPKAGTHKMLGSEGPAGHPGSARFLSPGPAASPRPRLCQAGGSRKTARPCPAPTGRALLCVS